MSGTRESSPLRVRLSNVSADHATYSFSPLPVQVGCFRLGPFYGLPNPGTPGFGPGEGAERAKSARGEGLLNPGRCTPHPALCSLHSQRATSPARGEGKRASGSGRGITHRVSPVLI